MRRQFLETSTSELGPDCGVLDLGACDVRTGRQHTADFLVLTADRHSVLQVAP